MTSTPPQGTIPPRTKVPVTLLSSSSIFRKSGNNNHASTTTSPLVNLEAKKSTAEPVQIIPAAATTKSSIPPRRPLTASSRPNTSTSDQQRRKANIDYSLLERKPLANYASALVSPEGSFNNNNNTNYTNANAIPQRSRRISSSVLSFSSNTGVNNSNNNSMNIPDEMRVKSPADFIREGMGRRVDSASPTRNSTISGSEQTKKRPPVVPFWAKQAMNGRRVVNNKENNTTNSSRPTSGLQRRPMSSRLRQRQAVSVGIFDCVVADDDNLGKKGEAEEEDEEL